MSVNKTDVRHELLTSLIKNIFVTLVNSTIHNEDNSFTVIRGKGKEIDKCSFTDLYRTYYINLFEYTFTRKNCEFKYVGKQKINQVYDRNTAIDNAVKFFKKESVDLDYHFRSQAERFLFSQLIYKYIKLILDVIFDDYSNYRDINLEVRKRYNEVLVIIKQKVSGTDIHKLIYANIDVADMEVIFDPRYEQNECNRAFLINVEEQASVFLGVTPIKNKVMLCIKDNDYSSNGKSTTSEKHISGMQFEPYPFPSKGIFYISQDTRSLSMNVWPNLYRRFKNPRWFYFATKYSIEVNEMQNGYTDVLDYKVNTYSLDVYSAAFQAALVKYPQNKKDEYLQWLNSLNIILGQILELNYNDYFNGGYSKKISINPAFLKLKSFLNNNGIDSSNAEVIYIYLVSTLIDDLCQSIDTFNIEDMFKYLSLDNKEVKKILSKIKEQCKSRNLDVPCTKYKDFYEKNKACIKFFENQVEVSRDRCIASIADNVYNPYNYLKDILFSFSERLGTI